MPQTIDGATRDLEQTTLKELDIRSGFPGHLFDDFYRVRSLYLITVCLADNRPLPGDRSLVSVELDVVLSFLRVKGHPVMDRRAADQVKQVLLQTDENDITNDVSVVA